MTCRPLSGPLGAIGVQHCAVIVWHEECGRRVIDSQYSLQRGGTIPSIQGTTSNDVYNTDRDAFNNPGGGNTNYDIPVPTGMTSQQFDDAVTQSGDNYSQDPYWGAPGPNSNTAADNIIEGAGGVVPDVPGILGPIGQNWGE